MPQLLALLLYSLSFSLSAQYLSDVQEDFDYYQRVVKSPSAITPETFGLLNELQTKLFQRDSSRFQSRDWLLYQNIYLAIAEMPAEYRKMGRLEALARGISAAPKQGPSEKEQSRSIWWQYSRELLDEMNQALSTGAFQTAATHLIILSEIQDFLKQHPDARVSGKSLAAYADWLGGELGRLYADLAKHFRQEEAYEMAADMLNYGHYFYDKNRAIQEELLNLYLATNQIDRAKLQLSTLIRTHPNARADARKRWYFQRGTLYLQPPVDYGIARRAFEDALDIDSTYFEALFNMAQTYIAQSNLALQVWEAAGSDAKTYEQQYYRHLRRANEYLKRAQAIRNTEQVQRLLKQTQTDG